MIQLRSVLSSFKALPRRLSRNTSAATRLSLVAVIVSLSCLVITSLVGLQRGSELAEQSLRDRLTALAATRSDEIERYVEGIERATLSQAISPSTADAIDEFRAAFERLDAQEPSPAERTALVEYYSDTVAPELEAVRGRPVSTESLVPNRPGAVKIQTNYVVPYAADERAVIDDAGDGSAWSQVHRTFHPTFSEFVIQSGVADFYLIEPEENTIVYSTAKDIDAGTSLRTGPQSGTALAALINSMRNQSEPGSVAIADFTGYPPVGDEPSAFVASPVIIDDELHGYAAVRLGAEQLTAIAINDRDWGELGLTGETYVVGDDDRMRTDARGFIEDEDAYLRAVLAAGTATDDEVAAMATLGTTTLLQPVPDGNVDAALMGLTDANGLHGMRFKDIVFRYENAHPIGRMRPNGDVEINPGPNTIFDGADRLVLIADSDDHLELADDHLRQQDHPNEPMPTAPRSAGPDQQRVLIVGWNTLGARLISEWEQFAAPGSSVEIVYDPARLDGDDVRVDSVDGLAVTLTPTRRSTWHFHGISPSLALTTIVLLGYERGISPTEADSLTLLNLMLLRKALDELAGPTPSIVVELRDLDNVALARRAGADDYIVSDAIASCLIAQLAEQPDRRRVFLSLYTPSGPSIHLVSARDLGLSGTLRCADVVQGAYAAGVLAIGWRRRSDGDELRLNPRMSDRAHIEPDDQIVIVG